MPSSVSFPKAGNRLAAAGGGSKCRHRWWLPCSRLLVQHLRQGSYRGPSPPGRVKKTMSSESQAAEGEGRGRCRTVSPPPPAPPCPSPLRFLFLFSSCPNIFKFPRLRQQSDFVYLVSSADFVGFWLCCAPCSGKRTSLSPSFPGAGEAGATPQAMDRSPPRLHPPLALLLLGLLRNLPRGAGEVLLLGCCFVLFCAADKDAGNSISPQFSFCKRMPPEGKRRCAHFWETAAGTAPLPPGKASCQRYQAASAPLLPRQLSNKEGNNFGFRLLASEISYLFPCVPCF